VLLETVGALLEGARQATRFFIEGESTRKGPRPAWLDAACSVDVTGLTAGSAVVALEAPARPVASLLPQDEASGVSAFFGTWPGDETDEELLDALEAIR